MWFFKKNELSEVAKKVLKLLQSPSELTFKEPCYFIHMASEIHIISNYVGTKVLIDGINLFEDYEHVVLSEAFAAASLWHDDRIRKRTIEKVMKYNERT